MSQIMDEVVKQLKDASDAIRKSQDGQKEAIKAQVESVLKDVLRNHPGVTPERKLPVDGGNKIGMKKEDVIRSMPKDLQVESDGIFMMSKILGKRPQELKSWDSFTRRSGEFKKALDTATAGEGSEWVPTGLSPDLFELVRLQLRVAALFPTIPMPTNPFDVPYQIGKFVTTKHSEQTADTGQTELSKISTSSITGKTTFTAVPHGGIVLVSTEATEDSLVPMIPFMRQEVIQGLADGREDFIVNGDTAGTHEDSDITDSDDRRKIVLGLRALAHDNSYTRDLSTFSLGNLRLMRSDMGKYGVAPGQLAWITGIAGYIKLLDLDEVVTLEKYGPNATVLAGELGRIDGIPIIVSEYVREVLDANGVYNAAGTKTVLHLVRRDRFGIGERTRGEVTMLRELYAASSQIGALVRERVDFQPLTTISSERITNLGQNVG